MVDVDCERKGFCASATNVIATNAIGSFAFIFIESHFAGRCCGDTSHRSRELVEGVCFERLRYFRACQTICPLVSMYVSRDSITTRAIPWSKSSAALYLLAIAIL